MTVPRLIVANLDCELAWSRPGAPRALPRTVERRVAALGALMAAFGEDGDRLWTPVPVPGGRARLAGAIERGALADVELVTGALAAQVGHTGVLAWGETADTARARARSVGEPRAPSPHDWRTMPWAAPAVAVARRVNDRRFSAALADSLGVSLPGATVLDSVSALEAHLAQGGADAGGGAWGGDHAWGSTDGDRARGSGDGDHALGDADDRAWVLAAPLSASGRQRLRRRGRILDPGSRARARRLFAQFGELVFEPWVRRVADAGCVGIVGDPAPDPPGWRLAAPHQLHVDVAGVFRGVTVRQPDSGEDWLDPGERERVTAVAGAAARALAEAGYRGPFGVDAYVYTDGERRLQPLSEINARLSFGIVARALRERLGVSDSRTFSLWLGDCVPAGDDIVPLLAPTADDPSAAWCEISAARTRAGPGC